MVDFQPGDCLDLKLFKQLFQQFRSDGLPFIFLAGQAGVLHIEVTAQPDPFQVTGRLGHLIKGILSDSGCLIQRSHIPAAEFLQQHQLLPLAPGYQAQQQQSVSVSR